MIELTMNGERRGVAEGSSVLDLLAAHQLDPRTVAVERNGEIVRRERFGDTALTAGDRLEIVRFVQGG